MPYINPLANITTYVDNLTNISNNTLYNALQQYTNIIGKEAFFGLIFAFLIIGAYITSEGNRLTALAAVLVITVVCGVLISAIISIIFTIIIAILMTDIIYQTWVNK